MVTGYSLLVRCSVCTCPVHDSIGVRKPAVALKNIRLNSPPLTERNPCPPAEQSALEAARAEVIEVEVATEVALVDIVAITGDVAEVAACIMSRTMESNFRYEGERRTPT